MGRHPEREGSAVPHQAERTSPRRSSAWGMSGFPWRWSMPTRGSRSSGSTSTGPRSARAGRKSYIGDGPVRVGETGGRRGAVHGDHRLLRGRNGGHGQHLRPTPLRKTKDPDLSYIVGAMEHLLEYLHKDMLIVPREHNVPRNDAGGSRPDGGGEGVQGGEKHLPRILAERVDPGNAKFTTKNIPKVVGGVTPAARRWRWRSHRSVLENVHPVSTAARGRDGEADSRTRSGR